MARAKSARDRPHFSCVAGTGPLARLLPPPTMSAKISVSTGAETRHFGLQQGHRQILGRGLGCDLVIDEASVSRRHCSLLLHGDILVVTDLQSAGKTEKSRGANGLVVRKDLWDNGTIREAHDLIGRTLYTQAGPGSGQHASTIAMVGLRMLARGARMLAPP